MPDLYYLEKNVLTPEECEILKTYIENNSEEDYRPHYRHSGMYWQDIVTGKAPEEHMMLGKVLKLADQIFKKNYTFTYNRFEMKRMFGNIMYSGAINEAHDDDGDVYPGKKDVEEHYSCILMLNSDYEGGKLYFEHHDHEIRLEAGDLIMFRGNAANLHGVRKVISGKRVNVIIFFRNFELPQEYDFDIWQDFIES